MKRTILSLPAASVRSKAAGPGLELPVFDGGTHFGHEGLIKVQVMDGVQHAAKDFTVAEQVVQIAACELAAGIAAA